MTKSADRFFRLFSQVEKPLPEDFRKKYSKYKKLKLLNYIRENVIGRDIHFGGPFGLRKVTYLDYIASGRALNFIEDYIRDEVLPDYGNTHTTTGVTSLQTTLYRHEARDIIRNSVNASEHDVVIFVGSGTTGAIHKLIHGLNLTSPPIVFVGPYEHHSNLLPWRETTSEVIRIKQMRNGLVDIHDLETQLKKWKVKGRQMIGSFSAASNITGILVDVDNVTACLHRHGALAFWDYATAAPYVKIDMNPMMLGENEKLVYKDAVFLSPHKFVGGVSTPGVLIAKKSLFRNIVPEGGGGGTVMFVRRDGHRYLQELEEREEGGTPAIVESVRAGLVFQLKEAVTTELIMERERFLFKKAKSCWKDCANLVILGNLDVPRLPVFSFLIYHPESGRFLHYNFVSAVLNDVFGIQARGGCACAGPYAMDLLGLDELEAERMENLLMGDWRLDQINLPKYRECSQKDYLRCFKPGFTRLSLPYFIDDSCLEFVLEAVQLVAQHAHTLLPQYIFNPETGEWKQKNFKVFKDRKWLGHISYKTGEMSLKRPAQTEKGPLPSSYQDCLRMARDIFQKAEKTKVLLSDQTLLFDEETRPYRWFVLPSEAYTSLHNRTISPLPPQALPFIPQSLQIKLKMQMDHSDDGDVPDTGHTEQNPALKAQTPEPFLLGMVNTLERGFMIPQHVFSNDKGGHTTDLRKSIISADSTMKKEKKLAPPKAMIIAALKSLRASLECASKEADDKTEYTCEHDAGCKYICTSLDNQTKLQPHEPLFPRIVKIRQQGTVCSQEKSVNMDKKNDASIPLVNKHQINMSGETVANNGGSTQVASKHQTNTPGERVCNEVKDQKDLFRSDVGISGHHSSCTEIPQVHGQQEVSIATTIKSDSTTNCEPMQQNKWLSPPKVVFNPTVKAIAEYGMIRSGDRVLVCLSGGKDSLSLLHTIREYQFYAREKGIHFEFGAVTVDPQTSAYDPKPLKQYLSQLGVPYFYEYPCILETAESLAYECCSICSLYSRMKRGRIYSAARREGYNVLAMGQHLDDIAERFLMSFFHNGVICTMRAHYTVQEGDLHVIRPFVYVREKDLMNFSEQNMLPVISGKAPACFEVLQEHHLMKQLLATQELLFPHLYHSMMAAMKPVMARGRADVNNSSPRDTQQEDSHHARESEHTEENVYIENSYDGDDEVEHEIEEE